MISFSFGDILSYLVCFSGIDGDEEDEIEEEAETISEELSDETAKEFSDTAVSLVPERGMWTSMDYLVKCE